VVYNHEALPQKACAIQACSSPAETPWPILIFLRQSDRLHYLFPVPRLCAGIDVNMRPSRHSVEPLNVPTPPEVYNYRVYLLAIVASFGAIIFGYDLAFIGTTLSLDSFKRYTSLPARCSLSYVEADKICVNRDFHLSEDTDAFSANIVSLLQAGCFFGSLAAGQVGDKLGRKWALILSGAIFCIGSLMQTVSRGNVPVMFTGRAIGGLVSHSSCSRENQLK
jgi:hypothetical protein